MIISIVQAASNYECQSMSQKIVLLTLACICTREDGKQIFPSIATIAARSNCSRATTIRALQALEAQNIIFSDGMWGHCKCYGINLASLGIDAAALKQKLHSKSGGAPNISMPPSTPFEAALQGEEDLEYLVKQGYRPYADYMRARGIKGDIWRAYLHARKMYGLSEETEETVT